MIAPRNIDELHAHVGEEIGASGWQPVTQDQVRMRIRLESVEPRTGGADLTATLTFERAGGDRPVCVAEFLIRLQV